MRGSMLQPVWYLGASCSRASMLRCQARKHVIGESPDRILCTGHVLQILQITELRSNQLQRLRSLVIHYFHHASCPTWSHPAEVSLAISPLSTHHNSSLVESLFLISIPFVPYSRRRHGLFTSSFDMHNMPLVQGLLFLTTIQPFG